MACGRFARRCLAVAGLLEGTLTGPQAMLGSLETFGIEFKTDEVAAGIEAGDGGSARSDTTVKHKLSGIGFDATAQDNAAISAVSGDVVTAQITAEIAALS